MASDTVKSSAAVDSDQQIIAAGMTTEATANTASADAEGFMVAKPEQKQLDDGTTQYVTGYKLAIVIASIALSCFLMLLDTMIISTAIPRITDDFKSLHDIGWYASAYQFGSAAPQPLTGKLYTQFSTKWTFLVFFGIFELGSILCGAAVSSVMLIVGRAVAGLGAAGIIVGAITMIAGCAPLERRPALLGMLMGFNQLGLVAGPLVGGALTAYTTWRWCFYINLPLGAVAVIGIILLRVPEQTPKPPALSVLPKLHRVLDLGGFVLFAPAVLQLLLALQYGGDQYAWNSSHVIGLFCGSAVTFVVWLFWNHRKGASALLPEAMIRRRAVWTAGAYQAFLMSAMYGATYYLPIYFQAVNNATSIMSGVYLLPLILSQLVLAAASGQLITRVGYVIPFAIFSTILLTTASGLYSLLQPNDAAGKWVGFQIIAGVGSGAGLQVATMAVQAAVSGQELASGMAFVIFSQSLGPAIVLALSNVIFSASLKTQLAERAPNANATVIIDAGATAFRTYVSPSDLPGVLEAYANSIDRVFYLVASVAACGAIFLWGMGWHDLRRKPKPEGAGPGIKAGPAGAKTEKMDANKAETEEGQIA